MASSSTLDTLRHRAVRHAFEDGTIDLVAGFFTLIVAVSTQRKVFLGLAVVYLGAMAAAWKPLHASLTSQRTG